MCLHLVYMFINARAWGDVIYVRIVLCKYTAPIQAVYNLYNFKIKRHFYHFGLLYKSSCCKSFPLSNS